MGTSKSKFSNIICILFSISLVCLLDLFVSKRIGINNQVSNIILTAGVCAVFVGIAFLLNKYVSRIFNRFYVDDVKCFNIGFAFISLLFVVIRVLIIADIIKISPSLSVNAENAMIKEGNMFVDFTTIDGVFTTILSFFFKLLGNTFFPVYLVQFIFSILAFILVIFAFKDLFGIFTALFTGLYIAVIPDMYSTLACDSSVNFIFFIFALIVFVTAKYRKGLEYNDLNIIFSCLIGLICGIAGLYQAFFVYVILFPIIAIMEVNSELLSTKILNVLMVLLGAILGFVIPLSVDAFIINKNGIVGFSDNLFNVIATRFGFNFDFEILANYVSNTGIFVLLAMCIIYCVMYWLDAEDDMHILCTMFIMMLFQIAGNDINSSDAFKLCINISLVAIAAYGIKSLANERETYRIVKTEDDMEPAEIESINDKPISISSNSSVNDAAKRVAEKFELNAETIKNSNDNSNVVNTISDDKKEDSINIVQDETVNEIQADDIGETQTDDIVEIQADGLDEIKESNIPEIHEENVTDKVEIIENTENNIKPEEENNEPDDDIYVSKLKDEFDSLGADSLITTPSQELIDFERMFATGVTNLPPGVKMDETVEDRQQDEEENSNYEDADNITSDATYIESEEPKETQGSVMANQFFDYLFRDIPDNDPIVEEKKEESFEEKLNRYADLDIDLGTDAFNYIPKQEDTEEPESIEDALKLKIVEEELEEAKENLSIEDIIEAKIMIDDAIIEKEDLLMSAQSKEVEEEKSVEDIINEKLDIEENTSIQEQIEEKLDIEENTSIQEQLEQKLDIEENTSYEDLINEKLDMEEQIEADKENGIILSNDKDNNLVPDSIDLIFENAMSDTFKMEERIVLDDNLGEISDEFVFDDGEVELNKEDLTVSDEVLEDKILELEEDSALTLNFEEKTFEDELKIEEINESEISPVEEEFVFDDDSDMTNSTNQEIVSESSIEESILLFDSKHTNTLENNEFVLEEVSENYEADLHLSDLSEDFFVEEPETINDINDNVPDIYFEEEIKADETDLEESIDFTPEDNKGDNTVEAQTVEEKTIEFIENPLPLPKKHVHRDMDYGRSIPDVWMHYDVEINSSNNFYDV